ncbi:MAG: radical SAM protein [Elusimicrobia bacterium]|nr:radical SAM protein [Elusimicrobiota bacterium]
MKKKFYLQGKDLQHEVLQGDDIRFEWNIAYSCNFRCPYCFFDGKWEEYGKRTVYLNADEWAVHWNRIFGLYGRVSIVITGGEPFIYPDFIEIIRRVSLMHYPINISTNSTGDLDAFMNEIDPGKVSLTLAYHPDFNRLEDVIGRAGRLREKGFRMDYINFCAYPPYLQRLEEYIERARGEDVMLKVIPFCGIYDGKEYPASYTAAQKKMLGMDEKWQKNVAKKGSLCAAGYRSALIFPDGKVARCGQIGERHVLGDFFSESFRLMDAPGRCDAVMCPCLEVVPVDENPRQTDKE